MREPRYYDRSACREHFRYLFLMDTTKTTRWVCVGGQRGQRRRHSCRYASGEATQCQTRQSHAGRGEHWTNEAAIYRTLGLDYGKAGLKGLGGVMG